MSAAAAPSVRPSGLSRADGARALRALTRSEVRLFLRDPGAAFFALAFPAVLVLGVGFAFPGVRETLTDVPAPWDGLQLIHVFVPIALATAMATPALSTLPVAIATHRERGVLRRLSTTPLRPQAVLVAQVVVALGAFVVASVLALVAAGLAFDAPAPRQVGTALLVLVLGAGAIFGVGLLIAARAPKGTSASGIGMLVYFPMLFFAGMWTPGPVMPEAVRTVSQYTPLGAASQALTTAWFEGGFPALQLLVLVAYVVVLFPLAARLFRWT
ncbi:ABC transporter permease [Cellulomonas fimi]|uniref:Transport permease protein n=1 Tax=Cellulomonas fimi TaxID=1708 RepID=A0A7Y0QHN5_CELFI|nr:ABC transporter permease [Cellulomonas fimi]NMR20475.1 ABC transporter permease [Cellulomonas fimi]